MTLLVVPLSATQPWLLTLEEWDALTTRPAVLFDDPNHPLSDRLRSEGIEVRDLDGLPSVNEDVGVVLDPRSPLIIDLAKEGAEVSVRPAAPPDDLTAAYAAPVLRRAAASLASLVAIMARLRSADGCPWDREQSHESLKVHLLEEAYEVIESIERGEVGEELEEELGDVLLQVVFHSRMAEQDGRFDVAGVADRLVAKLVNRHPHVFGDTEVSSAGEVIRNWEAIKAEEKERADPFEGIPASLPALLAAYKTQKRAAQLGFVALENEARERLAGAMSTEVLDAEDLGDALFWLVALARARGLDPEAALRRATANFRASF